MNWVVASGEMSSRSYQIARKTEGCGSSHPSQQQQQLGLGENWGRFEGEAGLFIDWRSSFISASFGWRRRTVHSSASLRQWQRKRWRQSQPPAPPAGPAGPARAMRPRAPCAAAAAASAMRCCCCCFLPPAPMSSQVREGENQRRCFSMVVFAITFYSNIQFANRFHH